MSTLGKFWKIILSYKWGLLLQFAIFVGIAVFLTLTSDDGGAVDEFESLAGVKVAIFDRDQTELTEGFVMFMSEMHEIVDLEDSEEEWIDAVMFSEASIILEIPTGFTEAFISDSDPQVEYLLGNMSFNGFLVRSQVERYFHLLSLYLAGGFDVLEANVLTVEALETGAEVELVETEDELFIESYIYFRFLPMSLLTIVTLATGGVFLALNKQDVTRRIESAPISYKRRTVERIIACLTFGLVSWGVFMVVSFVLFGESMMDTENLIRIVNSLPLILLGIALAFVITQYMEKKEYLFTVVFSVVMTLTLPAGIMMDMSMMGDQLLAVARFTPLYWYSRINDMMIFESAIDWTLLWQGLAIQLAFATAILAVGMVFSKEKRSKKT